MFGEATAKVMIAWPSTSMRVTTGVSTSPGRSPMIWSIASLTSCTALSVGTSMRNSTAVVVEPSLTVEMTFFTPVRPATASSISRVTCFSSSAGAAPLCVVVTATSGTSMLGNRVIGSELNDCQPSTISRQNARMGAIGLRMDQAEKFMEKS